MSNRIALLAVLLAAPAFAVDANFQHNQDIVNRAFQAFDRDYKEDWAWSETSTEEDSVYVGRYDPRRAPCERWTLESIDGDSPTPEEIDDYLADKNRHCEEEAESVSVNGRDMVNFETLELVEETDERWVFSFVPNEDEDEDDEHAREFMKHMLGTITVIKDGHYVGELDIRADKPVKPATGVKIKKFRTTLTFGPAAEGGPIVPLSVDVEVSGRAMLFIRFDETESVRFHAYEFAAL